MLILKVIIWFLLLILHKMSSYFAKQLWNQLQYKSCYSSKTYVNFEGVWLLLLISHKMSFSYFREIVLEPVLDQLQYKSCYCLETYVNFKGNYMIFTPNVT